MITHPHINPVAIEIFGQPVHWYGLTYVGGLICAWFIAQTIKKNPLYADLKKLDIDSLILSAFFGIVIGGRLGYVLFYNPAHYFQHPLDILRIRDGGMSFHGGLIGVILAMWIVSRQLAKTTGAPLRIAFLRILDLAAVMTPPGLGLGRLGNFINIELPGRVTSADLPWAFNFGIPDELPRHPSPLYQMLIEGVILTVLMLFLARRRWHAGTLAGAFLVAYGTGRFFTEFFREPDQQLGFFLNYFSMGQLLCLPMIMLGAALLTYPRWWRWSPMVDEVPPAPVMEQADAIATNDTLTDDENHNAFGQRHGTWKQSFQTIVKHWYAWFADGNNDDDSDHQRKKIPILTRREKRRARKKKLG